MTVAQTAHPDTTQKTHKTATHQQNLKLKASTTKPPSNAKKHGENPPDSHPPPKQQPYKTTTRLV